MGHRNFCCDGCQTHNFHGRRFHCLRCVNYDLCGECYDQHVETLDHRVEHPMQLLLDQERHQQLPELLLNGEMLELMHLPNCYTCPYCGIFGHTAKELIDHVVTMHRQADNHVVCPMCAGLPGIELVAIRNLARHLLLNHIEHANLLDPNTPPLRHALARVSRRRRRQQPPNPSNQNGNNSRSSARSNSSRMDSEAGIDILYQLSELRRLRPELRLSQTPANYLEGDPRSRSTTLAIASPEALTNGPAQGSGNEAAGSSALLLEHSDADRYLLHQWMAEQHADLETALRDNSQRQQHALFTEHLLLSMLCEEQLQLPQSKPETEPEPESEILQHLLFPEPDEEEDAQSVDRKNEDLISLLPCKYIPSQIMMLMSLPWIRPWSTQSKQRYIELQGVTLEESALTGSEQQDID
ncbi:E3 ubiquitin-protein ligase KCMF1-like [Drosophila novamexicana]|uniref:E3 ubiquitin-protein ligase KCMF1-like n=1 Tax=Drosophila novamexicana TaxID=47314 RepID=UPI0011E5A800|nr:E3 ubiquitin-protein ligase KCMF1-like [Drosophila novamexicana]